MATTAAAEELHICQLAWLQPACVTSRRRHSAAGAGGGDGCEQASTGIAVLRELDTFPLVDALFGRRSRRFALGAGIPDGSCVAVQAQYVFDAFGEFPGAVLSVFIINYVRANRLDPGFATGFRPGAYLRIHPSTCSAGMAGRKEADRWGSTYAREGSTCGPSAGERGPTSCS
jgi:hypothetical protein